VQPRDGSDFGGGRAEGAGGGRGYVDAARLERRISMRPGTTIALAVLLAVILGAAFVQFVVLR
jgi:hypothetical protein